MASALYGTHITFTNLHQHSRHRSVRHARVIDEAANAHAPHRATLDLPDEKSKLGKSRRHQLDGDQASQRLLLVQLLDVLDKVPAPHTHYHKDGYTEWISGTQRHSAALSCTQLHSAPNPHL